MQIIFNNTLRFFFNSTRAYNVIFNTLLKKIKKIQYWISCWMHLNRYKYTKRKYPLVGVTKKDDFYYWTKFSKGLLRYFSVHRNVLLSHKFTRFYTHMIDIEEKTYTLKKKIVQIKKKFNILKKKTNTTRALLFQIGARVAKDFNYRRTPFKNAAEFNFNWSKNKKIIENKNVLKTYKINKQALHDNSAKSIRYNCKSRFQRVFFENRNIFRESINRRNLKQFRFDKYYNNFFKKSYTNLILNMEFSLMNLLLRSRFALTTKHVYDILSNEIVFVNGGLVRNNKKIILPNDIIQLKIQSTYYFYYKRLLSNLYYLKKFISYRVWRMVRFLHAEFKQPATNTPKWVLQLLYFKRDVPDFLEIDYTCLSCIFLYYPENFSDYSKHHFKFINFYLLRLYNWKYII